MSFQLKTFDHFQIPIPPGREAESHAFYGGVLGLAEKPRPAVITGPGRWYDFGGQELHTLEEENFQVSKRHAAFVVDELLATRKWLEEKGVRTSDTGKIPGRERFFFYDPFGNRFELIEYEREN